MHEDILSFTIWARSTIESDIFVYKPAEWFKIWFFLVSKAFWQDGKMLKRGECLLTFKQISDATGATRDQVDKAMRWLRASRMIDAKKTTRGNRIFVVNYAKYQDMEYGKKRQPSDSRATRERHAGDSIDEQENKRTREQGEGGAHAAPPPTPREDAIDFFKDPDVRQPIIESLAANGTPDEAIKREIDKFVLYWTEPTSNGIRQRWETERTFEVKRRLATWLQRASKDSINQRPRQVWRVAK